MGRLDLVQHAGGALVHLDRKDRGGLRVEQGAGEAAGSRADLDDVAAGQVAGGGGYAGEDRRVEQEVLAERAAGVEAVALDDLPE